MVRPKAIMHKTSHITSTVIKAATMLSRVTILILVLMEPGKGTMIKATKMIRN